MGIRSALGGLIKRVAPVASYIPGVGNLVAGGVGMAGSLLDDSDGGFGSALKHGGSAALGGLVGGGGTAGAVGKGILGRVGDFVKGNPELVLGGLSAIQNARQGSKADGLIDEGVALARRDAELAHAARGDALGRLRGIDVAGRTADPSNPFDRSNIVSVPPTDTKPARRAVPRVGGGGGGSGRIVRAQGDLI